MGVKLDVKWDVRSEFSYAVFFGCLLELACSFDKLTVSVVKDHDITAISPNINFDFVVIHLLSLHSYMLTNEYTQSLLSPTRSLPKEKKRYNRN